MPRPPHPPSRFLSRRFSRVRSATTSLSAVASTPQILDLVRSCGTSRVTGQALLASLQEGLRPAIVQVLRDTLAAAQLGDAVLAAQAFQNDPDLFLRRILLACRPADVLDDLLAGSFAKLECCLIFAPVNATMSQKHSLLQSAQFVPRVLTVDNRTLVMVMVNGIGAHLTNDEKRAHLIDLKRDHLIDQVCVQEFAAGKISL